MAENKDQLVDERTMEKMSVAPPDPETGALRSHGERGAQGDESLMERRRDHPADQQIKCDAAMHDTAGEASSGVADQDPLSAHPS